MWLVGQNWGGWGLAVLVVVGAPASACTHGAAGPAQHRQPCKPGRSRQGGAPGAAGSQGDEAARLVSHLQGSTHSMGVMSSEIWARGEGGCAVRTSRGSWSRQTEQPQHSALRMPASAARPPAALAPGRPPACIDSAGTPARKTVWKAAATAR